MVLAMRRLRMYFQEKTIIMKKKGTLSQVMNRLRTEEGYTEDFNLLDHHLEHTGTKDRIPPEDFIVDEVYRFEGPSNPSDNAVLYAITTTNGIKGILVDGYGIYGGQISDGLLKKLDLKSNRPID